MAEKRNVAGPELPMPPTSRSALEARYCELAYDVLDGPTRSFENRLSANTFDEYDGDVRDVDVSANHEHGRSLTVAGVDFDLTKRPITGLSFNAGGSHSPGKGEPHV